MNPSTSTATTDEPDKETMVGSKPNLTDSSILHTPIKLGIKNVKQIIGALKDGTHEVKDVLLNQCNIIYECKICQNLFRCLANLLAHKRFYCKESHPATSSLQTDLTEEDKMVIIEPTGVSDEELDMSDFDNNDNEAEKVAEKPSEKVVQEVALSSPKIFETVKPNPTNKFSGITRNISFTTKVHMISLETIDQNSNAKTQVIKKRDSAMLEKLLKVEATKPCAVQLNKIEPNPSKIQPKKVIPSKGSPVSRDNPLANRTDCDINKLICLRCNFKFSMFKSLYSHMTIVHATKRLHFPCPVCNTTFLKVQSVKRHLMTNHKKTTQQVERLKDSIRRKAYYKKVQGPSQTASTEVKVKKSVPKSHWHKCRLCQRAFDRKSSQISHEKACLRAKARANLSLGANKPPKPAVPPGTKKCGQCRRNYSVFEAECICKKTSFVTNVRKKVSLQARSASTPATPPSNVDARPKRITNKRENKDFVDSQSLKWRSANCVESVTSTKDKAPPTESVGLPPAIERRLLMFMNSKRNSCLKCCRKFSSISNLRRHVATHVGWTRFQCKLCSYRSFYKADVRVHVEKHHTNVPAKNLESMVDQVHRLSSIGPPGVGTPNSSKEFVTRKSSVSSPEPVIRPTKHKSSPTTSKSLASTIQHLTSRMLASPNSQPFIKKELEMLEVEKEQAPELMHVDDIKNEYLSDLEFNTMRQNARIGTTTKPIITTLIRKDFLTQMNSGGEESLITSEQLRKTPDNTLVPIPVSLVKVNNSPLSSSKRYTTLVTRSGTYHKKIGGSEEV